LLWKRYKSINLRLTFFILFIRLMLFLLLILVDVVFVEVDVHELEDVEDVFVDVDDAVLDDVVVRIVAAVVGVSRRCHC